MAKIVAHTSSPLAQFITGRLRELGMKQVDFCRQTGFDQGLLSKLQTGVITTVNLESALRIAEGLRVQPGDVLTLLGKDDAHRLLEKLYGGNVCSECSGSADAAPESVRRITTAAQRAATLGRDLSPVLVLLRQLGATRRAAADAELATVEIH
ncbi:MAG TPA: helix-turn-helix transcriptional regulator [Pyrinomonadaceae bacterium]|jgi:DNA-binding Xre family transcriptional regulator